MYAAPDLPQPHINHSTSSIPPSNQYQSQMSHQTSSVPQNPIDSPLMLTQLMTEFPQLDSSLAVPVFNQGNDPIACLNKVMTFMSSVAASRFSSTNNQLKTSFNLRNQVTIQDDPGFSDCHDVQTTIIHNAAFQTDDLDAYDSDCDDISSAKAVLMANLSKYGSDVLSEIPNFETYQNDMDNQRSMENRDLKGQIQEEVFVTTTLQNELSRFKGKNVLDNVFTITNATTIALGMFKLDIKPISHRPKNNRDAYEDYFKKTIENTDTICGLVERARKQNPSEPLLDSACVFTKHVQELLVYVSKTCPGITKSSKKLVAVTPKNKNKKVRHSELTMKMLESHTKHQLQALLNRTALSKDETALVEAARTMLIFSKATLFLWAEAVATACYTQNGSLIRKHHNKTPYELLHNKKPDLSYLHVFGALCYPTNNSEDLGKLQPKANIGIFVGYAPTKKAFWIYNRRTHLIIETIHVTFDWLTVMASEKFSLGPGPQLITPATLDSGIMPNPPSPTPVDFLVPTANAPVPAHSTSIPSSTLVDQDVPSPSTSQTPQDTQAPVLSFGVEEENHDTKVSHMDNDQYFGLQILEPSSKESSS
uniref:Retrovirus-related Pol polyprotein from transposon TNT 1-94 n=1 Tax=Tanacetum cinerariifolium TaxID=118510 RepID=A0A6L2LS65_TANCI|nr:retrovirus-related Pol polyprotein from transposon TNT 1-94 [Tanacetum cinerariifolium]